MRERIELRDGVRLQDRITNEVLTSAVNVSDGGDRRSLDLRRYSRGHGRLGPGLGDHSAAELPLGIAVGTASRPSALATDTHTLLPLHTHHSGRLYGESEGGAGE